LFAKERRLAGADSRLAVNIDVLTFLTKPGVDGLVIRGHRRIVVGHHLGAAAVDELDARRNPYTISFKERINIRFAEAAAH
jgi:hypothetical protein